MQDYEPIDLSEICNSSAGVLPEGADVALGRRTFRGLPFLLGGGSDKDRLVVAGGPNGPVTVPIGKAAHRVIVAHRLLEVREDAPTGARVAEYVFRFAGGEDRVPIREQFEIESPRSDRGTFNAIGTDNPSLQSRYQGEFGRAGRRQTEGLGGVKLPFTLWVWESPRPGETVHSLEIVPHAATIAVGGLTVGHVDEHPFARQGRRPVRIDLKDPEAADAPFDLEVSVDRGDATYPYPLPEQSSHLLTVFEGDLTFMRNIVNQHEPGTVTHHHGEVDHLAYLSRPFLEARDAVLERMKDRGVAM